MGRRGPTSRFDLDEVRGLLIDEELTPEQMAKRLGCSRSTAYNLALRAGVKLERKPSPANLARRKAWKRVLAQEPNQAAAARAMGTSRQAASRQAARLALEAGEGKDGGDL